MRTALSVAAERLGLNPTGRQFLAAMLTATPLAIAGERTMVPMSALRKVLEDEGRGADDCDRDGVYAAAGDLMKPRNFQAGMVALSFATADYLEWGVDSTFMEFRLNSTFLNLLRDLAEREQLALF